MNEICFSVKGIPSPQGSHKVFMVKGKPIITDTNKNLKVWRELIANKAKKCAPTKKLLEGPIEVEPIFVMPRPKNIPKTKRAHIKRPDLDKLIRAVFDSLTGTIITDDSHIYSLHAAKIYETEKISPGVTICIRKKDDHIAWW